MADGLGALADAKRVVTYDVALDVARTLGPLRGPGGDPTSALHGQTYWKAMRTPSGSCTVAARPTGHRQVTFWAWGEGSEVTLAAVDRWLGLDDPLEAFDPTLHPVVARLARDQRGVRMGRFGGVFERLVPTIFGQLVIANEAQASYRRLIYRFGDVAPGPEPLRLAPAPETLLELGDHHFHQVGVERRRATIVKRAASKAERLDRLVEGTPEDAYRFLTAIPGIGPWTTASVGRVAFGDPDAVVVGDYNLPHLVAWVLEGRRRSSDAEMLELLEPFAGHRGRVQAMVKAGGAKLRGKPPRHGPKSAFRSIERH